MLGQGEGEAVPLADLAMAPPVVLGAQHSRFQGHERFERGDLETMSTSEESVRADASLPAQSRRLPWCGCFTSPDAHELCSPRRKWSRPIFDKLVALT
jgi:hypothetical protein